MKVGIPRPQGGGGESQVRSVRFPRPGRSRLHRWIDNDLAYRQPLRHPSEHVNNSHLIVNQYPHLVRSQVVMALLLPVALTVALLASAYLTYLTTDALITQNLRDTAITHLRAPTQTDYEKALDDYRDRIHEALTTDDPVPTDAPQPPQDPTSVSLLTCRWCAALWISLPVVTLTRLAMTATYPPLWGGLPLHPLDVLVIPAWALANAYAIGFLASREGNT